MGGVLFACKTYCLLNGKKKENNQKTAIEEDDDGAMAPSLCLYSTVFTLNLYSTRPSSNDINKQYNRRRHDIIGPRVPFVFQ